MESISDDDRKECRKEIGIDNNETRDLLMGQKSTRHIDKTDIYKKPKETIGQRESYFFHDGHTSYTRIKSSSDKYNTPDHYTRD